MNDEQKEALSVSIRYAMKLMTSLNDEMLEYAKKHAELYKKAELQPQIIILESLIILMIKLILQHKNKEHNKKRLRKIIKKALDDDYDLSECVTSKEV